MVYNFYYIVCRLDNVTTAIYIKTQIKACVSATTVVQIFVTRALFIILWLISHAEVFPNTS